MKLILAIAPTTAPAQAVWHWLQQQGVTAAQPSRREQLNPEALQALMTKTQRPAGGGATGLQHQHKLWAELAADLLLANVDQTHWGWPQKLDAAQVAFWLHFDPSVVLALGYTSPQAALRPLLQGHTLPSHEQVDAALRQWHQQHSALLQCHYQHRHNSVLINTGALERPQADTRPLAQAVLQSLGLLNTLSPDSPDSTSEQTDAPGQPTTEPTLQPMEQQLEACLLASLLERMPEATALYQELEAVAHWPASDPLEPPQAPTVPAIWQALQQAQVAYARDQQVLAYKLVQAEQAAQQETQLLQVKLQQLKQQLETQAQAHQAALAQAEQATQAAKDAADEAAIEHKKQLDAAMAQQAELEAQLRAELKAEQAARTQEQATWAQKLAAAEQSLASERASLTDRLQAAEAQIKPLLAQQQQLKELTEENELLLDQLHHVQEEFEALFLKNSELEKAHQAEIEKLNQDKTALTQQLAAQAKAHEAAVAQATQASQALKKAADEAAAAHKKQLDAAQAQKSQLEAQLQTQLKAEQAARTQEQTTWAQKLKAAEQTLATERASLTERLQAAEAQVKPLLGQQHQLKELTEENEQLLAQLHQAQDELESLFLKNAELDKAQNAQQAELEKLNQDKAALTQQLAAQATASESIVAQAKKATQAANKAADEAAAAHKTQLEAAQAQLKAEQTARIQEQSTWAQKLKAAEQTLATERASLTERLQAAEAQVKPLLGQQHQVKKLTDENELLLAQLYQLQEELEHYFLELKQARKTHQTELAPLAFECEFWRRHAPAEVWVDMRQDIVGDGWYDAEADGRWTGPELTSTLRMPPMSPGHYTLELHLADAIEPELVSGLSLQALRHDGTPIQSIELLHEFGAGPSLYPMVSLGALHLPELDGQWTLQLTLPFNVSPADAGGADTRRLGLRVQGLRLSVNEGEALHYVEADADANTYADAVLDSGPFTTATTAEKP